MFIVYHLCYIIFLGIFSYILSKNRSLAYIFIPVLLLYTLFHINIKEYHKDIFALVKGLSIAIPIIFYTFYDIFPKFVPIIFSYILLVLPV